MQIVNESYTKPEIFVNIFDSIVDRLHCILLLGDIILLSHVVVQYKLISANFIMQVYLLFTIT